MTTTATTPVYLYRRNALYGMSYQILKSMDGDMIPVGDYAVLDSSEDPRVTEARLMNLVSLMNGHTMLLDAARVEGKSLYFQRLPKGEGETRQRIMFRERGTTGISTENAILTLNEGDLQ